MHRSVISGCARASRFGAALAVASGLTAVCWSAAFSEGTGRAEPATEVQVAVASNFALPMRQIAAAFGAETGDRVVTIVGATAKLRAQIQNGAPVDVFLAADTATPVALEAAKLAVEGTRFTYALGKLVLWSARPGYVDPAGAILKRGDFRHLAVANPKLAPYGVAAIEALTRLGLLEALRPRLVEGEDIAQTRALVASGNAELGFIAASQRAAPAAASASPAPAPPPESFWMVPANLYAPIRQDAVLLRRGERNAAARAFLTFLRGPKARATIVAFGYGLDTAR